MPGRVTKWFGKRLAAYLSQPRRRYERFTRNNIKELRQIMQPGDVLLVEGNTRFSTAIKYLTQSTWSHSALYIGDTLSNPELGENLDLVEADAVKGVIAVPLSKYRGYNIRVCRPMGLSRDDADKVAAYMISKLGDSYDMKHIFDLMRYLLPTPPVPSRYRRWLLAFGSGDPTKAICSSLMAQAFQAVKFPILPRTGFQCVNHPAEVSDETILQARHYTHFTPRDFDLSPYFGVIKPTVEAGFDYRKVHWQEGASESSGEVDEHRPQADTGDEDGKANTFPRRGQ